MALFGFAVATVVATFVLLLVGGTVNPTGSSLACPDWPTCYGSFFPAMRDGVEFEHTHRVVATLVGLMTAVLAGWIWTERKGERTTRALGLVAAGLVVVQGLLGGITVLLRLPLFVSTAHLALSMFFFLFLIYLAKRLWPGSAEGATAVATMVSPPSSPSRVWLALATVLVYAQIVLGALVRHTKSGRACSDDWLLCAGSFWPSWGPAQLHMLHRLVGVAVALVVVAVAHVALRAAKRRQNVPRLARFALLAAPFLVTSQVALGLITVATGIGLVPVTAHLGVGALLLGDLFVAYLALPARVPSQLPGSAPSNHYVLPAPEATP